MCLDALEIHVHRERPHGDNHGNADMPVKIHDVRRNKNGNVEGTDHGNQNNDTRKVKIDFSTFVGTCNP